MTEKEQVALNLGNIRDKVLATALENLSVQESVPAELVESLREALEEERPPKAAALVKLFEEHFRSMKT